ncbi:glucosamine 6-phosphate N-acetyltransferase-like [Physella acuta]|uniref:glucosamine 6-phosphate N-acetyltransferase-like n=1 Tax=Physella acuta TaxID=109671 RepID=UPI0027DC950C|nr:glucosamine 6-phosphate N-acetyltransferase-like [Physella acuta]
MSGVVENGCDETYMYDSAIYNKLDKTKFKAEYKNGVTPLNPGENFIIRPLCISDYDKGYLNLLKELTIVGDLTKEQFISQFNRMKSCADTYYITVIEDVVKGQIIGTATLVVERKFIHHASARARVEDVVVNNDYRGQQIGKILVDLLVCLSEMLGCYKVSLECKDHNVNFYTLFGFENPPEQNFMQIRFFE